jgi:hypothetical protein
VTNAAEFGLPVVEVVRASELGLNDTVIWIRLTTSPPQLPPATVEILKAVVVAWGTQGETRAFDPEGFSMPFLEESTPDEVFEHQDTGLSILQWQVWTEMYFGDRSLRELATWIQRALYTGGIHDRESGPDWRRVSATLWIGV